jgi:hypothetical protein
LPGLRHSVFAGPGSIRVAVLLLLVSTFMLAQTLPDISGMYKFLEEGEFVQVTRESDGSVTGFVSHFGDLPSDKGAFLDYFFKTASLQGSALEFTTQTVHGIAYTFRGNVDRGPGKQRGDEAYWILRGTLTETSTSADGKTSSRSRQVEFKSFPSDAGGPR